MPVRILLHLSWTTLDRRPMIGEPEHAFLRRFLPAEAQRHGSTVLACGIVVDHVHLVLQLSPAFDVPRLVQGLKGASARLASVAIGASRTGLRWARGYHAVSVSPRNLTDVIRYVRAQSEHHPDRAIPS